MNQAEITYHTIGRSILDAQESQMFGKPCFKIKGKAFTCFFQDCMVFKLPGEAHQHALGLEGARLFDPSGKERPMKEWVQVPFAHAGKWEEYALAAHKYVSGTAQ